MLQLPEPKLKSFMSTTALLHTPSVLVNIENISSSNGAVRRRSSSNPGSDAGWLRLAAPPTSRNAKLLPLSSRKLVRSDPKWPGTAGPDSCSAVARSNMAVDGSPI